MATHYTYVLYDPETKTVTSRFRTRRAAEIGQRLARDRSGEYSRQLDVLPIHHPLVKAYKKSHPFFHLTPEQRARMVA